MRRVLYILKQMLHMVRSQHIYFIAPMLVVLALLAFLVYYVGPAIIISFLYAGI